MSPNLIKLIEDNGLTLHGDIEHFAHLIEERTREKCIKACKMEFAWESIAQRCENAIRRTA